MPPKGAKSSLSGNETAERQKEQAVDTRSKKRKDFLENARKRVDKAFENWLSKKTRQFSDEDELPKTEEEYYEEFLKEIPNFRDEVQDTGPGAAQSQPAQSQPARSAEPTLNETIAELITSWSDLKLQLKSNTEAINEVLHLLDTAEKTAAVLEQKIIEEAQDYQLFKDAVEKEGAKMRKEHDDKLQSESTKYDHLYAAFNKLQSMLSKSPDEDKTNELKKNLDALRGLMGEVKKVLTEQTVLGEKLKKRARQGPDEEPTLSRTAPFTPRVAGEFTELFGAKPGKKSGEVPGTSVTPMTLYRYMQQQWKAYNPKSLLDPPSSFSPGDVGYIPFIVLNHEEMRTGGWIKKNMLKAASENKPYIGENPRFAGSRQKFGADEVAIYNEAARKRGLATLNKMIVTHRQQKEAVGTEKKNNTKIKKILALSAQMPK